MATMKLEFILFNNTIKLLKINFSVLGKNRSLVKMAIEKSTQETLILIIFRVLNGIKENIDHI